MTARSTRVLNQMSIRRNRKKEVFVDHIVVVSLSAAATLQVGDVQQAIPSAKSRSFGGQRGAPSFVAGQFAAYQETILHFVNHRDQDRGDQQILFGKLQEAVAVRRKDLAGKNQTASNTPGEHGDSKR